MRTRRIASNVAFYAIVAIASVFLSFIFISYELVPPGLRRSPGRVDPRALSWSRCEDDKQGVHTAAWLLALHVTAIAALPRPDGYVNDFASVFTDADEAYLEGFLQTLERDTSAEIAVATVVSLDGATIEEYASRLFAEWRIGKQHQENGVLLLVAVRNGRFASK